MIHWHFIDYEHLSVSQLYAVLQLRAEVFVVEQDCVYQDLDGWDQKAMHCLGYEDSTMDSLVAYARIFLPNVRFPGYSSIGRILTHHNSRGTGAGRRLVQQCIDWLYRHAPETPVKIQAQDYLRSFYSSFGFEPVSEVYPEDGIPHVDMLLHFK